MNSYFTLILLYSILRQKDLTEIPLIQQQHLMRSRGQWRWPFSGQGSGPSTNTQSEHLSFCLFPVLISDIFFFFLLLKKLQNQYSNPTHSFHRWRNWGSKFLYGFPTWSAEVSCPQGLLVLKTPPCDRWRHLKVERRQRWISYWGFTTVLPASS